MMKCYQVCTEPDIDIFNKMCAKIEERITDLVKSELLEDVDGSLFQVYENAEHRLVVKNSYDIGAVFIETDMDLEQIFPE